MKQKPKLLSGGLTHRFIRGYTVSMKRNRKPPLEVVEDVIMISEKSKDKNIDTENPTKIQKINRRDKIEGLNFEVCRTC